MPAGARPQSSSDVYCAEIAVDTSSIEVTTVGGYVTDSVKPYRVIFSVTVEFYPGESLVASLSRRVSRHVVELDRLVVFQRAFRRFDFVG